MMNTVGNDHKPFTSNKIDIHMPMKTSDSISIGSSVPSLFQIAAFFEDLFPSEGLNRSAAAISHLPIAEYMLNPDKLMALLRSAKTADSSTATAPAKKTGPAKAATRNGPKKTTGSSLGKANGSNGSEDVIESLTRLPKKVEFTFKSPLATSVKLAGDFTEWETNPIEMMRSDGVWFTVVPLPPGSYSYRFIVDGCWCDDPGSDQRIPNPFGTQNAVIHVT